MRQEIQPKELPKPAPYALAYRIGDHVWLAGQTAVGEGEQPVGLGDAKAQAECIFKRIGILLKEAGATPQDVIFIRTFYTDIRHQATVREVRQAFFQGHRPASTTVQVTALARTEFLLEVEIEAIVGSGK